MGKLIVTIARQYGSGGKTIGQMLAENLGAIIPQHGTLHVVIAHT